MLTGLLLSTCFDRRYTDAMTDTACWPASPQTH